ncbi:MAG: N-acetylmuramoyl-L-alanine amidase [Pseudomonadota bacterium]
MRRVDEIIIHCTATRAEWWSTRTVKQKTAEVRKWHVEDRGWSDIGYHFLIDRDGKVATGRPIDRDGAHVRGHNKGTIGIALFGGHGGNEDDTFDDHFTPAQDAALRKMIAHLKDSYPTISKITGHHEYSAKACPCFRVTPWLEKGVHARGKPVSRAKPQITIRVPSRRDKAVGTAVPLGLFVLLAAWIGDIL